MWTPIENPLGSVGLSAIVAFIPLLWLLISLGWMKWPAYQACFIAVLLSAILAIAAWNMPVYLAFTGAVDGAVLGLWPIVWVIVAAIFAYNVTVQTGAMDKIKGLMSSMSADRRIQALMIAWGFGGFLEASAGFGTAVAIPAAILIGLGFNPFFAAVICMIANTVPVAFGAVGIPVITLAKVTDLNLLQITYHTALQLTPFVIILPPALVVILTKSFRGLKGVWMTALAAGLSFAIPQLIIARFVGPELTAVLGSVISMATVAVFAKWMAPEKNWLFPEERNQTVQNIRFRTSLGEQLRAWSPYLLLFVFIFGSSSLFPTVYQALSAVRTDLFIYIPDPAHAKPSIISWLATPGTMIMTGALIGGLIQGASLGKLLKIFGHTVVQLKWTIVTVLSIVAMAREMSYSGMVTSIANALAMTGPLFPFLAPLIGALGTFVTGSDTNANVLFGPLQAKTAVAVGADPSWIAAANTTGATAGKMISPQSIAVATGATGQSGKEGDILGETWKYCLVYVLILGVYVYVFAFTNNVFSIM